eukprot:1826296-Karenia_brevis.AAC.1
MDVFSAKRLSFPAVPSWPLAGGAKVLESKVEERPCRAVSKLKKFEEAKVDPPVQPLTLCGGSG